MPHVSARGVARRRSAGYGREPPRLRRRPPRWRAPPPKEPVSQQQAESTALLPAASPSGNGDNTDYSVGADNTVVVQAAETLGHFADWSKVSSASLRALNRLHKNAMVTLGHKVKLDLSQVSAAQFEAARRDYHRQLQESFFRHPPNCRH